ncbi:hypothetical protein SUGI_1513550 [Cryptomeria japonica]|uniref:Uncharacterized protein n=1 Tax=Cryptomeria japonica TaxID=3369 RepID=A0AAD3RRX9_CRYJA|nr:hypothetical protein SUGI_1505370 [Cryptomeria japonica]GLJ59545.1 hypothetical protein SUGI_1513550 [Cryptomeria japonica]
MSATEPFTVDSTNPETRSDTPETHDDTKPYTNSSCPHVIVNVINVIARATRSIARLGLLEIRIDLILLSLRLRLRIASRHRWNNDKKPATVPAALVNVATGLLVHNPPRPDCVETAIDPEKPYPDRRDLWLASKTSNTSDSPA